LSGAWLRFDETGDLGLGRGYGGRGFGSFAGVDFGAEGDYALDDEGGVVASAAAVVVAAHFGWG